MNILTRLHPWLLNYSVNKIKSPSKYREEGKKHIFLCICDHFEPFWAGASKEAALERVRLWCEEYPKIAQKYKDSEGCILKYTFFYPAEEYEPECLDLLAKLCHKGYSEVEVHLHHDKDTEDNLRSTLIKFKGLLSHEHGLLSKDKETKEIKYGFIHGNWALDNSNPKGLYCGVNNEIDILQETGCYADFTMPSAPDTTQTTKINSLYYAIDNPRKVKSHNYGIDAKKGKNNQKGLLMVQGPLTLNWKRRKWGVFARIENGCIGHNQRVSEERIKYWEDSKVHVKGEPNYLFIKLYTHGCQEENSFYLLNEGLDKLFSCLSSSYKDINNCIIHFVSARELVNVIKSIENNSIGQIQEMKDHQYKLVTDRNTN